MAVILNGIEQTATRQIVGNLSDGHSDATLYGYAKQTSEHNHGVTKALPLLAGGVLLTKAGGAWAAFGTPTEIIAASAIGSDFDIHWAQVAAMSANGEYMIALYQGAGGSETLIAEIPITRNAVQSQEGSVQIVTPLMSANARISGAISSGNVAADTLIIKVSYHTY